MYQELQQVTETLTGPGGPFEIHEIEVRGQRVRAYKHAPGDLRTLWELAAGYGDRDYLVYGDERTTYAEAHRVVASVAAELADRFDVGAGDRVAIAMRNYPEWILAYWATVSLGATVVGMNAWWTPSELAYALADSTPKVIVADAERLERLGQLTDELDGVALVGVRVPEAPAGVTPWDELVGRLDAAPPHPEIGADDDACIFYTSGTTGHPKGAQLTHLGCVNNVLNLAFWNTASAMAMQAAAGEERSGGSSTGGLVALVVTPLFHVTANNCVAHTVTLAGGTLVLMYKWDPAEALELIERERVVTMSGVPTMVRELLAHPSFADHDTSSLKSLGGGGAQIQPDLVARVDEQVASARPGTGYGMTETCGVITMNSADFFVAKPDSAGPLLPTFEGKVIGPDGQDLPSGEIGELCVRGAPVIKGYLNQPEATAETITDGWLHTGDIARLDEDGFVHLVDRAKDMVLRGGENVYCVEVEAALYHHPEVSEAVVFGVPDERLGEEVGAAVVLADGSTVDADGLRAHVGRELAAYKVPRHVWILDEPLPRNANGKFVKRALRDRLDVADAT